MKTCSEVTPGPTIRIESNRRSLHDNMEDKKTSCGEWFGAKRSRNSLNFSAQKSLPYLGVLLFILFPFLVLFCFRHPAVIVREVVLCFFLCIFHFQEFVEVVFPSSFGSSYLSSSFNAFVRRKLFRTIFFRKGNNSSCHSPTSFFCVFQSSMVFFFVFPCALRPLWCFF